MKNMAALVVIGVIIAVVAVFFITQFKFAKTDLMPAQVTNQEEQSMQQAPLPPIAIEAIRSKQYPGGQIIIEREVGDKGTYKSYVVSYPSDGLKLYALMNVPNGIKPEGGFPVIILNHGYIPPKQYSTVNSYPTFTDYYARNGYLVVKPDYRGNAQSEGEPVEARSSADYTTDVLNLVNSIKTIPEANANKIGMWGHSMGGGITLQALTATNQIKAAVLWAGVIGSAQDIYNAAKDPSSPQWIKTAAQILTEKYGDPTANQTVWNNISALNFVGDIMAPIEIHHGTNDEDVPLQFSQHLDQILTEKQKPHQFFVYNGANHNFTGPERATFLQRTKEFFDKNLK